MKWPHQVRFVELWLDGDKYLIAPVNAHAVVANFAGQTTVVEPGEYMLMDKNFNIAIVDGDTGERFIKRFGRKKHERK